MVSAVRGAGLGVLPDAEPCDLILVPSTPEGLSAAVGQVHQRYTRRINFREKWRGYLWQGRFGSFVLDDTHLLRATAYVERNPVAAGLVGEATAWPWSSAAGHVTGRTDAVAEGDWLSERIGGWVCTWAEYLPESDGEATGRLLARHESTGRPLGGRNFVEQSVELATCCRRNGHGLGAFFAAARQGKRWTVKPGEQLVARAEPAGQSLRELRVEGVRSGPR